ncbi:putative isoaspartyl peptidase/L-asparaginase 2 [Hordeum vulgare]|nr:putative isoaspartyl peptidase/L-asparaginase 2 [Hordeum vulgare]
MKRKLAKTGFKSPYDSDYDDDEPYEYNSRDDVEDGNKESFIEKEAQKIREKGKAAYFRGECSDAHIAPQSQSPGMGLELVDNNYFITEKNRIAQVGQGANNILSDYRIPLVGANTCCALVAAMESHCNNDMVMNAVTITSTHQKQWGCAVVDCNGFTVAATSTGGLMNKMTCRIGGERTGLRL